MFKRQKRLDNIKINGFQNWGILLGWGSGVRMMTVSLSGYGRMNDKEREIWQHVIMS